MIHNQSLSHWYSFVTDSRVPVRKASMEAWMFCCNIWLEFNNLWYIWWYILNNMHIVYHALCFVVVGHGSFLPTFFTVILWWHHQMEMFSTLLALCAGNSLVTSEFPKQRPVMRSLDGIFDLHLNKQLSKQWWGWWFETLCPLWHYCNISRTCQWCKGRLLELLDHGNSQAW